MRKASPLRLVITSVPPGEAPLWVREKWIGLSLPLHQSESSPSSFFTFGVVSGPRHFLTSLLAFILGRSKRESGFVVESKTAIELLLQHNPDAAKWWHEHTPYLLKAGQYFLFDAACGHIQDASLDL